MKSFKIILILGVLFLLPGFVPVAYSQWEPDVRLTYSDSATLTCTNNAKFIAASGNTVHVAWLENRDGRYRIYYKRSLDGGAVWGPDTALTGDSAAPFPPCLAVSGSWVHLIWQSQKTGPQKKIFYLRSADGGTTWDPEIQLESDTTSSEYPSVAASGPYVHLVWHDFKRDSMSLHPDIIYQRSSDGGATWTPTTRLTSDPASSMKPSIAAYGSAVHLAWFDNRGGPWRLFYKRSADGGDTWSSDTALGSATSDCFPPSIGAYGPDVSLTWDAGNVLHYIHSTTAGTTWIPDTILTAILTRCPSIAASGSYVHIVWHGHEDGKCKVTYGRSTDRGATWGMDIFLTADTLGIDFPSIAISDTKVHLAWNDNRNGVWQIYYKRNPTGNSGIETKEKSSQKPEFKIIVKPNPFTSIAAVPGHFSERFALFDITGRKVGIYQGDRIGSDMAPGVYFLRLMGRDSSPVRLVKVR